MSDPTGIAYLKTFQALYQLGELVIGLVTWSMLASQKYTLYGPLRFALGVLVFTWIMTLLFFIIYITGFHVRINAFFSSRGGASNNTGSGESTSGSLAPPSGSSVPQIRWFVCEYITYLIMSIFLFVAMICMTSQTHNNGVWIGACVIGWALAIMYEIHFCLLFRNVESLWPYQWCFGCFRKCSSGQGNREETKALVASETGASSTSQP